MAPSLLLHAVLGVSFAQVEASPALYVAEPASSKPEIKGWDIENVWRISFDANNKLQKELVVVKSPSLTWNERIGDQFVVGYDSVVVDLQKKKVLNDDDVRKRRVLGIEGQKIFYEFEYTYPMVVFAFDLQTGKTEKLDKPGHWSLPDVKSPDKTLSLTNNGGFIELHRLDGSSTLLGGFTIDYHPNSTMSRSPHRIIHGPGPVLWLDNKHFLTQKKNGILVVVDLDGKAETLVEIKDAPLVHIGPYLTTDAVGRIIYTCDRNEYLVDVKAKSAVPLERYALGHGFEASVKLVDEKRLIYHDGKLIGKLREHLYLDSARTAPGVIAFGTGTAPERGKHDGLTVWTEKTGEWQELKMYFHSVIGWSK